MNNTEQWLADGKCSICRRKNYCSKPCRACNERKDDEMRHLVARAVMDNILKSHK